MSRASPTSSSETVPTVLVVGAGFSGLAAALTLARRAPEEVQVQVLEASDRVGGRARSGQLRLAGPVELGATWLHGLVDHPVYAEALRLGVIRPADSSAEAADAEAGRWAMQFSVPGAAAALSDAHKAAALAAFAQFSAALEEAEGVAAAQSPSSPRRSLGSVLRARFDAVMAAADAAGASSSAASEGAGDGPPPEDADELGAWLAAEPGRRASFTDGWGCRERMQRLYDGYASTDTAGLTHAVEYEELEGPDVPLPGGFQHLAQLLAAEAQAAGVAVRLRARVQRVDWRRPDGRVGLRLAPGPGSSGGGDGGSSGGSTGELLLADAVIFTASLGVLKEQAASLFAPPLPADKQRAIQQLEIGAVEKLFFEWPASAGSNAAAGEAAVASAGSRGSGQQPFTTHCLVWPSQQHWWGEAWWTQQQQKQQSAARQQPAVWRLFGIPAADPVFAASSTAGVDALPEWLRGLHSWRYGDGPEWIKPPHGAAVREAWRAVQPPRVQPPQPQRSAVLWATGRSALAMAALSDAQVLEQVGELLAAHPSIPLPPGAAAAAGSDRRDAKALMRGVRLLRSNWSGSELTRGSYSYPGVAASGESADALARPLAGPGGAARVCFAGEATSRAHMGTLHGAFGSGVREAERLLEQWGL